MSRKSDAIALDDMLKHARRVQGLLRGVSLEAFRFDLTARDSVNWNLLIVGEAATRLSEGFHEDHPHVPWRDIIDFRNVLAHGYDVIDVERVYRIATTNVPKLIDDLLRLLREYPGAADPS